jgi:hypothetical protein
VGLFIVIGLVWLGMTFLPDLLPTGATGVVPASPTATAEVLTETEALPENTATPIPVVPDAEKLPINVDTGSADLNWYSGEAKGKAMGTGALSFTVGQSLHLENGADVSELTLPMNDTRLFLDARSIIILEEIGVNNTLLEIVQGKLLVVAGSSDVVVKNVLDGRINLETGMLAVTFAETPSFKFQVDCMVGTCSMIIKKDDRTVERTVPVHQSLCDGGGCDVGGEETALRYEEYVHLSNLVPKPTSTPTPTLTPTPTATYTPMPTSTPTSTPTPISAKGFSVFEKVPKS